MKSVVSFVFFWGVAISRLWAQVPASSVHSHNDYAQAEPFWGAYNLRCGSIEADVYLQQGELMVAHLPTEIRPERTLAKMYLEPLDTQLQGQKGYPLQLLIDLKTPATATLDTLVSQLQKWPTLTHPNSPIKIVISGNMPTPQDFDRYPNWIHFDGRFTQVYSAAQLERVALMSMSFGNVGKWNSKGPLDATTYQKAVEWVQKAHQMGKKIRFWATPDTPQAWQTLQQMQADWIGTDTPQVLLK